MHSISVIIPNYNGRDLLEKNLPEVVKAFDNKKNHIKEVIVVDDGSKDDSIEFLKKNYPQIKTIKHKINRGFSAAVNTGARSSSGELLSLLNSDVVPEVNFLEHVIKDFRDYSVFAVSLNEQNFGRAKGKFVDGFIIHEGVKPSAKVERTFWVNGGSGVFRRNYWMELGGMDEKLFSPFYWEDVDICYRAAKRGWISIWEPKSLVSHEHESTVSKISKSYRQRIQERNQLLFIWKNLTSPALFRKHLRGLVKRILKHPGYSIIFLMALSKFGIVLKLRKKEIKEGKISDEAILSGF